jgi:hypothetical protein
MSKKRLFLAVACAYLITLDAAILQMPSAFGFLGGFFGSSDARAKFLYWSALSLCLVFSMVRRLRAPKRRK